MGTKNHNIDTSTARTLGGRGYVRELVRTRDNHTCQTCGKKWREGMRRFDVHHLNWLCGKRSLKVDKISDMDGLITLCHKCHFNHPQHTLGQYPKVKPSKARSASYYKKLYNY